MFKSNNQTIKQFSPGGIDRRGEDLICCKNNCTKKMMRKDHRIAFRGCAQSRVDGPRSASCRNGLFTLANAANAANRVYDANTAILAGGGGANSLRSVEFRVESVECGALPCSALHFCFHVSAPLRLCVSFHPTFHSQLYTLHFTLSCASASLRELKYLGVWENSRRAAEAQRIWKV